MPRYRICFSRGEEQNYLSHLDLMRTLTRALRRAALPVQYSRGFNPQPRLVFAAPLPVGITTEADFFDLFLKEELAEAQIHALLNDNLPQGLKIVSVYTVREDAPPLMAEVEAALYVVSLDNAGIEGKWATVRETLQAAIADICATDELVVERKGKKKTKKVNIRPFILEISFQEESAEEISIRILLQTGNKGGARPDEVLAALCQRVPWSFKELYNPRIHRQKLFKRACQVLVPLATDKTTDNMERR
ncbi:MAG: TIGR03936 family radical SAM-associated protein [Dethiobacteria bacterium]|jgi:radical SAM-linked protein|nr:DUF2344 domain-containing protein [Bacillota bacterium]